MDLDYRPKAHWEIITAHCDCQCSRCGFILKSHLEPEGEPVRYTSLPLICPNCGADTWDED